MTYWIMVWEPSMNAWERARANNNAGIGWNDINRAHQELAHCHRTSLVPKGLAYDYVLADDPTFQSPKPSTV